MPQQVNRDPAGQGGSGASWDNPSSGAHESSAATGGSSSMREEAARLGAAAARQAKEQAARYAEGGKEAVSEHLDAFAQAIRKAGDELSERDQTMAAQVVRQAARGLEGLSRSVHGASFEDVIGSVRRFGREHPTALIGGAVLAGLALGRFVRASRQRSYEREEWERGRADFGDWTERLGRSQDPAASAYRSGYPAGEGPAFAPPSRAMGDSATAPSAAQGYAGGGMGTAATPSPSSLTEPSVTSSDHAGGSEPGAISTGNT